MNKISREISDSKEGLRILIFGVYTLNIQRFLKEGELLLQGTAVA